MSEFEGHLGQYIQTNAQRLRLEGEICPNPECNAVIFPPRDICPDCHTQTKDESGKPRITIVYHASSAKISANGRAHP